MCACPWLRQRLLDVDNVSHQKQARIYMANILYMKSYEYDLTLRSGLHSWKAETEVPVVRSAERLLVVHGQKMNTV